MRYVVAYGKRAKKQWLVCSAQCIPPDRGNFDGHVDEEPLGILPSRRHRQKKMCVNCCNELSGREQGPLRLQMGKQATTRLLIMLCVLVQACDRSAAIEGSRPDPKLQIIQDSAAIVLCQKEDGKSGCQTVDPCGQCGRGRCSNLDDPCMASGILKSGTS